MQSSVQTDLVVLEVAAAEQSWDWLEPPCRDDEGDSREVSTLQNLNSKTLRQQLFELLNAQVARHGTYT